MHIFAFCFDNPNTAICMENIDLQRLRKSLLTGGVKEIAQRAGVSSTTVTLVFKGKSSNLTVLKAISEVAREHKVQKQKVQKAIDEALNQ